MNKILLLILFFLCCSLSVMYAATKCKNLNDTLKLNQITVTAQKKNVLQGVGVKSTKLEQIALSSNMTKSLGELLLENTPLQVKSMGQGAMTTISIRGTSAAHTKVLWNGISINSPQLGTFDFSQVPVYFVDDVSVSFGGGSQQGGSGSLGGSVNFKNNDSHVEKPIYSVLGEIASNSTYTGAINYKSSINRFTFSTRAYYQQSENNYKYLNKVYSNEHFYERRKDAAYNQAGVMQEVYYRTKKGDKLQGIFWWQWDDRELPQSIIVTASAKENTISSNIRGLISYDANRKGLQMKYSGAYLESRMDYSRRFGEYDATDFLNINKSVILQSNFSYNKIQHLILAANVNYRYDDVVSDNIQDRKKDRNTFSANISGVYSPIRNFKIDASFTGEIASSKVYGLYNVSASYVAIERYLILKASNNYNYRVPTLNDLYWNPGGNPQLKPETGFNTDFTAVTNFNIWQLKASCETSFYYMDIKDWIMWIPKGNGYIWEPVNFSNVISKGFELNADLKYLYRDFENKLNLNYAYAHSTDNSNRNEGTQGRQLPYIPRNRWNITYSASLKESIWIKYNISYTDKRYTSADESYFTNSYLVNNAEIGYKFLLYKNLRVSLSIKGDNLFNAYYESTQYYPMPLRMFWFRMIIFTI